MQPTFKPTSCELPNDIAVRLAAERRRLDIGSRDAAILAGISADEYRQCEIGSAALSALALARLAISAGFDADYVLTGRIQVFASLDATEETSRG